MAANNADARTAMMGYGKPYQTKSCRDPAYLGFVSYYRDHMCASSAPREKISGRAESFASQSKKSYLKVLIQKMNSDIAVALQDRQVASRKCVA